MATYVATVTWTRDGARFTDNRYSRAHRWQFDGGLDVPASASPHVVPAPLSDPAGIDPEEAFVAALSSCHMLWFLSIAARRGFVVEQYTDDAKGTMAEDDEGRHAMTEVTLRPRITYASDATPDGETESAMHHEAHEACFIANSVRTQVHVEPPRNDAP